MVVQDADAFAEEHTLPDTVTSIVFTHRFWKTTPSSFPYSDRVVEIGQCIYDDSHADLSIFPSLESRIQEPHPQPRDDATAHAHAPHGPL